MNASRAAQPSAVCGAKPPASSSAMGKSVQAQVAVDRDHEPQVAALLQALAMTRWQNHPPLRVEGDLGSAAEHVSKRGVAPLPPTFSHSLPL